MAGLLDSLNAATSGLTAARLALDVTGQNIANINTPGYVRRRLELAERAPSDAESAGRGVDVVQVRALRDTYIESRIGHEEAGKSRDAARLDGLRNIEAAVGLPGSSIDAKLTLFYDGFSALAADVTSPAARDTVVREGQELARAFNALSADVAETQRATDRSIQDSVRELNQLASEVGQLNARISAAVGPDTESLRDERQVLLHRMSELADVSVLHRADGAVDVTVAGGYALVVGASSYGVEMTPQPPTGFVTLSLADYDITGQLTNGRIGGLVELRDSSIPGYQSRLDQLAYDVATAVNTAHQAGFDAGGAAGGAFFTPPAAVAGAAAALSVSAAIQGDPLLVAASGTGASGDNQTARAIAALRDAPLASGGTATGAEAWASLVYNVGADVRATDVSSGTRDQIVRQLQRLRDQQSGVSLDEEAANLMRFQRSYEASARYFTVIVDTLDTLMGMVR
jgi:flagellar hook-associated protein 1 FlgK